MARDYKHRVQSRDYQNRRRTSQDTGSIGLVKWMLITALIIGFAVFLVYLKSPRVQKLDTSAQAPIIPDKNQTDKTVHNGKNPAEPVKEKKPQPPQFDFYTILPKKEMVVPEHEIKTRTREEQIGKSKKASYVIQAGSYREATAADELKAKLALMGIESKIQKAKVESVTWYRVKIGPYSEMSNVNSVMSRLQKNGMKPVLTEIDGKAE